MPYHLPSDDIIGSCKIEFSIPSDQLWVAVIIGAISELAYAENWEVGSGDLTVAEAVTTALEILDSVSFTAC